MPLTQQNTSDEAAALRAHTHIHFFNLQALEIWSSRLQGHNMRSRPELTTGDWSHIAIIIQSPGLSVELFTLTLTHLIFFLLILSINCTSHNA